MNYVRYNYQIGELIDDKSIYNHGKWLSERRINCACKLKSVWYVVGELIWFTVVSYIWEFIFNVFRIFCRNWMISLQDSFNISWYCRSPQTSYGGKLENPSILQSIADVALRISVTLCQFFMTLMFFRICLTIFVQDMHNSLLHLPQFLWEGELHCCAYHVFIFTFPLQTILLVLLFGIVCYNS